ncbi:C39 family peptidase [Streptomyces sp. NBC_01092]|uniref:C39 family peptidase n=1 Tax=Streptomyces sp. NBC_01092 TaxID=2903748 RepID=UPI00386BC8CF|nr:C39 family peptidase [Streptomyces sp. NBC_01092]
MTDSAITHPVPYYSQYESAVMIPDLIAGTRTAGDDPLWLKSGADSREEYAFWAPRMCGVACLRMALDYWGHPVPPSVPLVRELCDAGAYVRDGDTVKGLIYRPFAEHTQARWGIAAQVEPDLTTEALHRHLGGGGLALISVHKTIRHPETTEPPSRGGHLVLAVGATEEALLIHNPSGLPDSSQEFARVPWARLAAFYAGRGVLLG